MASILILFTDPHLPYSPTTLNLYKALKQENDITVLTIHDRHFSKIDNPDFVYLDIPYLFKKIWGLLNKISLTSGRILMSFLKKYVITKYLKGKYFDHLILTDPISLWMVATIPYGNKHLLSLELTFNTTFFLKKVNLNILDSIIIQSGERLQFLAPNFNKAVFIIQNAPKFNPALISSSHYFKDKGLVFTGTASAQFGIYSCLDFLELNTDYSLTIIGKIPMEVRNEINTRYGFLEKGGRLIIPEKYLSEDEMISEVSKFKIGFCFYDFTYNEINNFNYKTAPSGKMFSYFAASVPVIGIDIPGLFAVREFNAGILIPDLKTTTIAQAVKNIEENYAVYREGCLRAAAHFDFSRMVKPFFEFISQNPHV